MHAQQEREWGLDFRYLPIHIDQRLEQLAEQRKHADARLRMILDTEARMYQNFRALI